MCQSKLTCLCTHLSKGLLTVIFQVFGVNIKVVAVDSVRLGVFGYAGHKLLYFKSDWRFTAGFELPHGNVG